MSEEEETKDCKKREERKAFPIGVFDSGVGGISVLRAFLKRMPAEEFLYYGDSANAPYGTKTTEEVQKLAMHAAELLYEQGVKAIAVACNTATSAAIVMLREKYQKEIPIIGIEPALKPAALIKEHPGVLVLATPMTVKGDKFRHLLERFESAAEVVALGCPGLMEYVEKGILEGPELEQYLHGLLAEPMRDRQIDAVVLGCTHYPFVRRAIQKAVGPDIPIIDGSEGTAREMERQLAARGWLREETPGEQYRRPVSERVIFQTSDESKLPLMEKLLAAGTE